MTSRPIPPAFLHEPGDRFEPDRSLHDFLHAAFIDEGAPFGRSEYKHLREAKIGALWTNAERVKDGLLTLGMAQLYRNSGDRWVSGRSAQQTLEWFGSWWDDPLDPYPDFILTFYAPYAVGANDPSFAALCAHELRHCAQKRDRWGEPKFDKNGMPEFAMLAHDVGEFVSVVEDFGIEAAGPSAVQFVEAARQAPRFDAGVVAGVCSCGTRIQLVA